MEGLLKGLKSREAALRDKLDVAVFTPGEPNGRPLALPVVPPGFDQLQEADRERFAQYAAGALGSMIGFKSNDADKAQRAILAKAIETLAAVPGTLYARRYRGTGAAAQRYLALYYLTSAEIPNSTAWKAAANTPWTERMRPHLRDHLRIVSQRYRRCAP